jgi:hypothetical protein
MLTREDWDDISKLTFKNAEDSKIIEVKVIESFIGVKPYPVIVVMDTPLLSYVLRQYSIEGVSETKDDFYQIVKVSEPQEDRYLKPLLFIMKNSLPIAKGPNDTFISDLSAWSLITTVNQHKARFTIQGTRFDFSDIEKFVIMINNQELPFNEFINYLPKVNSVLNT